MDPNNIIENHDTNQQPQRNVQSGEKNSVLTRSGREIKKNIIFNILYFILNTK